MDQEYRDNIAGSPYLEEGIGQQLKARAANAISAGQAILGYGLDKPEHAKLKSLWETFAARLKKILADVDSQIAPLIRNRQAQKVDPATGNVSSPVNQEQEDMLTALEDLYNTLTNAAYQNIQGVRPQNAPSNLNKKTDVFGGKLNTKLKETIDEALWDAAKRGIGLNKPIAKRDPNKILNAYKNKIIKLYNDFIRDAVKVTGYPKNMISKVIKSIYPPQKYRDGLTKIESLSSMPDIGVPPQQTAQNSPKTAAQAPANNVPPQPLSQAQSQSSPMNNTSQPQAQSADSMEPVSGQEQATNLKLNVSNADFARILNKTIDIIIDAVQSDTSRSEKYLTHQSPRQSVLQPKLPKQWGEPGINERSSQIEAIDDPDEKAPSVKKIHKTKAELKNKFLYNFASKYNKWANFSIEVPPVNVSKTIQLMDGSSVDVNVILTNKKHSNDVIVKLKFKDGRIDQQAILRLYDDQVNPQGELGKKFNLATLLQQADPMGQDKLKGAEPEVVKSIQEKTNGIDSLFGRALYAITHRKSMEFSGIIESEPNLKFFSDGSVEDLDDVKKDANGVAETKKYSKSQVAAKVHSTDEDEATTWKSALNKIGYFENFPEVVKPIADYPVVADVIKALIGQGFKKEDATKRVKLAWVTLIGAGKSEYDIDVQTLYKLSLKSQETVPSPQTPETPKTPETEPTSSTEPTPSTPPKGKTSELQLAKVNKALKQHGIETLDNVQQMFKFFSIKGGYKLSGNEPTEDKINAWKEVVGKAKGKIPMTPKSGTKSEKSPPNPTNERINPYQKSNFLP